MRSRDTAAARGLVGGSGHAVGALSLALAALADRLVGLESDFTVGRARAVGLVGGSAAMWDDVDAGLNRVWVTYQGIDQLLADVSATPHEAQQLIDAAAVPDAAGHPTDVTAAMRAAEAAVDAATVVIRRLSHAWDDLAPRAIAARDAATAVGDTELAQVADVLADLLASDPLAVTDADVVAVEQRVEAGRRRHVERQTAARRVSVDLLHARAALAGLDERLGSARAELAHAASRIAGLSHADPVRDLAGLAEWLDRIAGAADDDPVQAAADMAACTAAVEHRQRELEAALASARDGLRRRDDGRGLWKALRAKAAARALDEVPDVMDALAAAQDELWTAPCDLAAAEAALATLARTLETGHGRRAAGEQ